jgi:hypothetical protein
MKSMMLSAVFTAVFIIVVAHAQKASAAPCTFDEIAGASDCGR